MKRLILLSVFAGLIPGIAFSQETFRYGRTAFTDPTTYAYPTPGLYFNSFFKPVNGVPENNYAAYLYLGDLTGEGNGSYVGLIAMGTNNGSLYTKRKAAGTWEANWRTIWDSGNFDPAKYLPLTGGAVTGNITIGDNVNQRQLNVSGLIKARKVKVTQTEWPDYVFDVNYDLPSLLSVEKFIQQNKHLPGIPSADSVIMNGLDLGSNQAAQLRKIEELTLYIIEQQKLIDAQRRKNEMLEHRMEAIEKLLSEGRLK